MALIQGNGYVADIREWWGGPDNYWAAGEGRDGPSYHEGEPSAEELQDQATKLTMEVTYANGEVVHYTAFSPIGWDYAELAVDVQDSAEYYESVLSGPPPEPPPGKPPKPSPPRGPRKPVKRGLFKRIRDAWRSFWRS